MKMMMKFMSLATLMFVAVAGCDPDSDASAAPRAGTLSIDMTDSPANYARLDINIRELEVYHETRGWMQLPVGVHSLNVLSLVNGATRAIASGDVPNGSITRLRILFGDDNSVKLNSSVVLGGIDFDAGSVLHLKWAHHTYYVELPVNAEVKAGQSSRVLLDFDAGTSVTQTSTAFMFDPAIREMTNVTTGARGLVVGGSAPAFIKFINRENMYSAYSDHEGRFMVRGMVDGDYAMEIRVMKRNPATGSIQEVVYHRADLTIQKNKIIDLGSIRL